MEDLSNTDIKIINATFEILQEEGFTKATTKKIATKAGVNEVTIFRNFENKKHLVEVTKEYHLNILLEKLEEIFDFSEDDEIEEYLHSNFVGLLNLPESDFSVIKVGMEEVRDVPEQKQMISRISKTVIGKLEEYFLVQIDKKRIRAVDARVLGGICFSITFQSIILWKVYENISETEANSYAQSFLDILYNGIKV